MSMQIKNILLYSKEGKLRKLDFKLGSLNIITGKSNTGKSTIIDIIEYCLGRSGFRIPEGIIRETVSWYGVTYKFADTEVLVAKPAPMNGEASQSRVYYKVGPSVKPPAYSELVPNTNDDMIVEYFSGLLGISSNLNIPEDGQTRDPLEATLKHARFYLFQKQGIVANQELLFHRQAEPFMPQAIKDTLPYFLGAIREDYLHLVEELRLARRQLNISLRRLSDAEAIYSEDQNTGVRLVAEAQQAGLVVLEVIPKSSKDIVAILAKTLSWKPSNQSGFTPDKMSKLEGKAYELRTQLEESQDKIYSVEAFVAGATEYNKEIQEQSTRLQSVTIFSETALKKEGVCPLCESKLHHQAPAYAAIKHSITEIKKDLEAVTGEKPRLQKYLNALYKERDALKSRLKATEYELSVLLNEKQSARDLQNQNARIARVLGRVSLYLESAESVGELSPLRKEVSLNQSAVASIEAKLNPQQMEENIASVLSELSGQMTEWAKFLDLEHKGYPYRLDINKLTVVADKNGHPIPMGVSMGGGSNWLGCHLIAHLALHKFFALQKRPVPNFLVLDQPTQVYFPSDKYKSMEGKVEAVKRMFNLLLKVCKELCPNFQIIVMDHANLGTKEFQDALVEAPWRGKNALVPEKW